MKSASDAELIKRFVRMGDQTAFELVVVRYGPMVQSVARKVLGESDSVKDVFQETFLLLSTKASSVRSRTT